MIPHGTDGGYVNHGCRCELCRKAHADAHREHNAARAAARVALVKRHPAEMRMLYEAICAARGLSTKVGPPFASDGKDERCPTCGSTPDKPLRRGARDDVLPGWFTLFAQGPYCEDACHSDALVEP